MIRYAVMILSILLGFSNCQQPNTEAVAELVPLALQGDIIEARKIYTEPVGSVVLNEQGNSSITSLYVEEGVSANCNGGAMEPPSNFGLEGPEAFVILCVDTEVNRFRNIEIRFSHAMNKASVESNFSITENGNPLPGPPPGGTFIWRSPKRVFFDPYRELGSKKTYTLQISSAALTVDGESLKPYSKNFTTMHDFLVNITLTQGSTTLTVGGPNDITFQSTGDIIVNANFINPGAFDQIQKIVVNRMGNVNSNGNPNSSAKLICDGNCTDLGTPLNLTSDPAFSATGMNLEEGGNTYYFEITTKSGAKFHRYFSFNWGKVYNPNNLINNVASGVLDQAQMMKMLERLLEVFIEQKFKVTNKTFNQFASEPTSTTRNTTYCIDYYNGGFSYISSYGDNPTGGYCGPAGNDGAYVGVYSGILNAWGHTYFDMDVYVTSISIPAYTGSNPSVDAAMGVNSPGELGVNISGRKSYIDLAIIARNRTNLALLIPAGSKFYFTTNVELNQSPTPTNLRLAQAKTSLTVNSSGNLNLNLFSLESPANKNDPNFIIAQWVDNLAVGGLNLVDSTSWAAQLLSIITEMVANGLVPQVKTAITQSVLKDIVEKIAPNVLNAIVGTLKNPGIDITLPPYLPPPLANYPLTVKVQLSTDAQVRQSGTNKGLVSSVHTAIVAKNPHPTPRQHANTSLCNPNGCVIYTKNQATPLVPVSTSAPFLESASKPGFLLALHSDAVTQAAYHLWKNRAIDLNVDSSFISSVNSYAGNDPLLKLTDSILKVSAITAIIAPGRNTLEGLDNSNNLLPAMCGGDDVRFKIDPIMPPVAKMVDNSEFNPNSPTSPNIQVTITDLQLTVQGRRTDNSPECTSKRGAPDNSYYTLATIRVSMNSKAAFRFVEFDNPNTTPNEYQNALSLKIFTSGLAYALDVLEGPTYNPYGLDPAGIKSVLEPLVTSLVVPLVNSILNKVPLPPEVEFQALNYPSSSTACKVNAKRDHALQFNSLPVPTVDQTTNPYLYAQVELKGNSLTDPKYLLEANCR